MHQANLLAVKEHAHLTRHPGETEKCIGFHLDKAEELGRNDAHAGTALGLVLC